MVKSDNLGQPQNMYKKIKGVFVRRLWWVFLAIVLVLLGLIMVLFFKKGVQEPPEKPPIQENNEVDNGIVMFAPEELSTAEVALERGITIEDDTEDYIQGNKGIEHDGKPNNPSPYLLAYTDLKSISVGADTDNIYFKFQFNGIFPDTSPVYKDDIITNIEGKVDYFNSEALKEDYYQLIALIRYPEKEFGEPDFLHYSFIATGGGMSENTTEGLIGGGAGTDYLLGSYPLSLFGLKMGDEITFQLTSETGSQKYHHENIDSLKSELNSKFGKTIRYEVGSDSYQFLDEPVIKE